jgi:hypothetical protein
MLRSYTCSHYDTRAGTMSPTRFGGSDVALGESGSPMPMCSSYTTMSIVVTNQPDVGHGLRIPQTLAATGLPTSGR